MVDSTFDHTGARQTSRRLCATVKSFPRRFGEKQISVCSAALIMSGRKPRSVANPLESAITTPSERILKECHNLYVDAENGK